MVAGPSPPPNLPLEVMGTPLIRLDLTSFSVKLLCICRIAAACVPACALAFAREAALATSNFWLPSGPMFRTKLLAWVF